MNRLSTVDDVSFSDETSKIHRWLLARPKWLYRPLCGVYVVGLALAFYLAVVPDPLYGNRLLWLVDVAVLSAFLLSHLAYRRHNRTAE